MAARSMPSASQQQGVGVGLVGWHNPRSQGGPEVAEPGGGDHPEAIADPALGTPQAHVEAADQGVAEQQRRALAVLGVLDRSVVGLDGVVLAGGQAPASGVDVNPVAGHGVPPWWRACGYACGRAWNPA